MKKILYIAVCLAVVVALGSCKKKAVTAGEAARQYTEHIMHDDYDAFVDAIAFREPVKPEVRKVVNAAHAKELRTIHHPDVTRRGGIKEVRLVSERPDARNKTADVIVRNVYNDGSIENMNYQMVNDNNLWKIRVTPNKEVWRATTAEGDLETVKIREGKERDFIKDKDNGEKQFVKDIVKRDGQVEVIKTLANGERQREVIKTLDEGNREIEKLKVNDDKLDAKDINRANKEVLKEKESVNGQVTKTREVIEK